jgi:hypothetical protein
MGQGLCGVGVDVGGTRLVAKPRADRLYDPLHRGLGVAGHEAGRGEGPHVVGEGRAGRGGEEIVMLERQKLGLFVVQDLGGRHFAASLDHEAGVGCQHVEVAHVVAVAVGVAVYDRPGIGLDREREAPLPPAVQWLQPELRVALGDRGIVVVGGRVPNTEPHCCCCC